MKGGPTDPASFPNFGENEQKLLLVFFFDFAKISILVAKNGILLSHSTVSTHGFYTNYINELQS